MRRINFAKSLGWINLPASESRGRKFACSVSSLSVGAFLLAAICSCTAAQKEAFRQKQSPLTIEAAKDFDRSSLSSIAIMPLDSSQTANISDADSENLQQSLVRNFNAYTNLTIANLDEEQRTASAIGSVENLALPERAKAQRLAQSLGVQAVLHGIVNTFDDTSPDGRTDHADSRAGFTLWLTDSQSGKTLWTAKYHAVNIPLSENMLLLPQKLKNGVRFESAAQMIDNGFRDAALSLSPEKALAESGKG
jgi:hypothetical protein